SPNIALGYRRNQGAGTWSVRVTGSGEWVKRIALADDLEPSNGRDVLSYWQAVDEARKLARRQPGDTDDSNDGRPLTVGEALDRYERDLEARGAGVYNAQWARKHAGSLLSRPVALLGANELKRWRNGLLKKGLAPATVNRIRNCLRAALETAAA